jgi:hypothetical protein
VTEKLVTEKWEQKKIYSAIHFSVTNILVAPAASFVESKLLIFAAQQEINC